VCNQVIAGDGKFSCLNLVYLHRNTKSSDIYGQYLSRERKQNIKKYRKFLSCTPASQKVVYSTSVKFVGFHSERMCCEIEVGLTSAGKI
jgi:hypothetical protein